MEETRRGELWTTLRGLLGTWGKGELERELTCGPGDSRAMSITTSRALPRGLPPVFPVPLPATDLQERAISNRADLDRGNLDVQDKGKGSLAQPTSLLVPGEDEDVQGVLVAGSEWTCLWCTGQVGMGSSRV